MPRAVAISCQRVADNLGTQETRAFLQRSRTRRQLKRTAGAAKPGWPSLVAYRHEAYLAFHAARAFAPRRSARVSSLLRHKVAILDGHCRADFRNPASRLARLPQARTTDRPRRNRSPLLGHCRREFRARSGRRLSPWSAALLIPLGGFARSPAARHRRRRTARPSRVLRIHVRPGPAALRYHFAAPPEILRHALGQRCTGRRGLYSALGLAPWSAGLAKPHFAASAESSLTPCALDVKDAEIVLGRRPGPCRPRGETISRLR
jgi:hypothetical protein